ncbi:protein FAM178B [Grus americana]|uniref:protein FAM178B n=1 Tax=Grus americana TaxID=9117 RepID=UPI002407ED20|nr:protein FAM178B [Grus americana]
MAPGPAMAPHPEGLRWYQIPLSSARVPRSGLFSYGFQAGLQRYQQLRALKRLRVGRPVAPPPPGLLEPWPPVSPPANSPTRASHRPWGTGGAQAPRHPKESLGTRKRVSRGRQLPGTAQPCANQQDVARRGSPPCRAAPNSSGHVSALPEVAAGSLGGEANRGQHAVAGMVPQQAGRSFGGHPPGTARGRVSPADSEDDDLIPLKDMLLAGDEPPSPADHQQVACPQLDPLANSLDSLVREKREQSQAGMLHAGVAWVHVDDASPCESPDEDAQLAKEQRYPCQPCLGLGGSTRCPLPARRCPPARRDFLARFTVKPKFIPAVHPGENIFCARPAPAPTLDTHGLEPQSTSERFFLCDSPACQAAFVRDGGLSLLYRCLPTCPLPVLRWLFQLMTLCPDTTNASQALWEIWLSTGGEPWCPTVQEITQAFARLGADLSPLCRRRLLPPELCPTGESPDPSCPPRQASPDATSMLALVTQLGDICKFLALCVVIQPCRYTDGARLSLVTLLSFLGLDRALRCQPLPELQHLLHCLLEGIRDWWEQLPALCLSLCQLSGHHHNLVALVQLLPDLTSRGRELRRRLSLHAMASLLREPLGTVPPAGVHAELQALGRLLVLAQPDTLRRLVLTGKELKDADWETCYLSYSLLLLASNVVGTEQPSAEHRGHLQQLCAQLDRHFGRGLREGTRLLFRTQLKGLATLLYVKWQEMLA